MVLEFCYIIFSEPGPCTIQNGNPTNPILAKHHPSSHLISFTYGLTLLKLSTFSVLGCLRSQSVDHCVYLKQPLNPLHVHYYSIPSHRALTDNSLLSTCYALLSWAQSEIKSPCSAFLLKVKFAVWYIINLTSFSSFFLSSFFFLVTFF